MIRHQNLRNCGGFLLLVKTLRFYLTLTVLYIIIIIKIAKNVFGKTESKKTVYSNLKLEE